jgi:FRG domain
VGRRREHFKTKDGRRYTLWADIDDLMSAIMPTYWCDEREDRRERGWMFRGQSDANWDLTPSLYRPPVDDLITQARRAYTDAFVSALRQEARGFGLRGLRDTDYLAVAQHYGLYSRLLDFSWNLEVAAYFASLGGQQVEVGVIYAFNAIEYEGLQNPFSAYGVSRAFSEAILKRGGREPLPDLALVELFEVPRIYAQEGVFIDVTPEKVEPLLRECIDRYYFRQHPRKVYAGRFPHREHLLMHSRWFKSPATYEAYLEAARQEHPDIFDRTSAVEVDTLFPPTDPLSKFAESWKGEHQDPTAVFGSRRTVDVGGGSPSMPRPRQAHAFAEQLDGYYGGGFADSPYEEEYLLEGRELLESLRAEPALDDADAQRWLLWELLNRTLPRSLVCTLKLSPAKKIDPHQDGFWFGLFDRWLAASYIHTFSPEQLTTGFWRVTFGTLSTRGRPITEASETNAIAAPDTRTRRRTPSNPHAAGEAPGLLRTIEAKLGRLDEGSAGSFLYDLHHVVMIATGRDLELTAGYLDSAPCLQESPLVGREHARGSRLLVRVDDHFTGGGTHTALCANHARYMSEADVDLMHPSPWTTLGLA